MKKKKNVIVLGFHTFLLHTSQQLFVVASVNYSLKSHLQTPASVKKIPYFPCKHDPGDRIRHHTHADMTKVYIVFGERK